LETGEQRDIITMEYYTKLYEIYQMALLSMNWVTLKITSATWNPFTIPYLWKYRTYWLELACRWIINITAVTDWKGTSRSQGRMLNKLHIFEAMWNTHIAPSVRRPVVDEVMMRPGHWLGPVLCVYFSGLRWRLGNRKDIRSIEITTSLLLKVFFQKRWRRTWVGRNQMTHVHLLKCSLNST